MRDEEITSAEALVLKEAAAEAADVVDEALNAVVASPLLGVAGNYLQALAERNDKALAAARLDAVEDEVIGLRDAFEKLKVSLAKAGMRPDRSDALTQAAIASEFVRDVSESKTTQKRTALVNATVHQYDPRKGAPATRDYWLRRVRELPEAEISFVLLLAEKKRIGIYQDQLLDLSGSDEATLALLPPLNLVLADVVAYKAMAQAMSDRTVGALVRKGDSFRARVSEGTVAALTNYLLTQQGEILVEYCSDD